MSYTAVKCPSCGGGGSYDETRGTGRCLYCGRAFERDDIRIQITTQTHTDREPLLRRAMDCLENREFEQADELFETFLALDPQDFRGYIGKLMVEIKSPTVADIPYCCQKPLAQYRHMEAAWRCADEYGQEVKEYFVELERLTNEQLEIAAASRAVERQAIAQAMEAYRAKKRIKDFWIGAAIGLILGLPLSCVGILSDSGVFLFPFINVLAALLIGAWYMNKQNG